MGVFANPTSKVTLALNPNLNPSPDLNPSPNLNFNPNPNPNPDSTSQSSPAKIRLAFEAAPFGYLVEAAGYLALTLTLP